MSASYTTKRWKLESVESDGSNAPDLRRDGWGQDDDRFVLCHTHGRHANYKPDCERFFFDQEIAAAGMGLDGWVRITGIGWLQEDWRSHKKGALVMLIHNRETNSRACAVTTDI